MTRIDHDNYEAFYLDALEGNLGEEDTALLMQFLEMHPDLKAELEDFDFVELKPDEQLTFDKASLKQEMNESNVEDFIIASLEHEIAPDDQQELDEYLNQSVAAQKLADRYKKTILPVPAIAYPGKSKLKKRSAVIYYLAPLVSAAAVLLLYFLLSIPTKEESGFPVVAEKVMTEKKDSLPSQSLKIAMSSSAERSEVEKESNLPAGIQSEKMKPKKRNISKENLATVKHEEQKEESPEKLLAENQSERERMELKPLQLPDSSVNIKAEEFIAEAKNDSTSKLVAQVKAKEKSADALTIRDLANKTIRAKVLKDNNRTTEKIKSKELLAAVVEKVDKNTSLDIAYHQTENSRSFQLAIGKFSISRTRRR